MIAFFNTILYQPLLNILVLMVLVTPSHNLGVGIILITILVRLILLPLNHKAIKSQFAMRELQPHIKAIQTKHKDDRQALSTATMQLYKDKGVSPWSGCLPMLIQLPILFVLYRVFIAGINGSNLNLIYSFIPRPEHIQTSFLWIHNITQPDPYYILPVLAGIMQYLQTKSAGLMPAAAPGDKSDTAANVTKQMMYLMPAMTVFIALKLPAGLPLYWSVMGLLVFLQQTYIMKKIKTSPPQTTSVTVRTKDGK